MNGIKTEVEAARLRLCGRSADLQATVCCHSVFRLKALGANSNRVKTINQLIFLAINGFFGKFQRFRGGSGLQFTPNPGSLAIMTARFKEKTDDPRY